MTKIDVSLCPKTASDASCTSVQIECIWYSTIGMGVEICLTQRLTFWRGSFLLTIQITGFSEFVGIPNNAGTSKTGDINFTTVGHTSGDSYSIVMKVKKSYG